MPASACAWCALRIDSDGPAMLRALEWVTLKPNPMRCSACTASTRIHYRPLAVTPVRKGRLCVEHLPFDHQGEAERVLGWLTRKAYEQA